MFDDELPLASIFGLVAPAPVYPPFQPVLEPPPPSPLGVAAMVAIGAAVAIDILVPKPPKKQDFGKELGKPNNRVLKLQDAFDVVDDVVTTNQIAWAFLLFLKANIHSFGKPSWIGMDEAFAEMGDEVTIKLRNALKKALADEVLQQMNKRLHGEFSRKGPGVTLGSSGQVGFENKPEPNNQRRGTMHHDKETGSGTFGA